MAGTYQEEALASYEEDKKRRAINHLKNLYSRLESCKRDAADTEKQIADFNPDAYQGY